MSIIAKQDFLKNVEQRLGYRFVAPQIQEISRILNEELISFEMEHGHISGDHEFYEVLKMFLESKRIEGCSEKTIKHYQYILKRMQELLDIPLRSITVFHLRSYLMKEKERGVSDRTLDGYRDVFRSFFGWSTVEGFIEKNPCNNLSKIKFTKKVLTPYSDIEIERLRSKCNSERDKAIIMFLLATGCRISEVCSINVDDLDFHNLECTVLGKGNKERTVYFDDVTAMIVQDYLKTRSDSLDALFVGKGGHRLLPGGVRTMLNHLAEKAGVEHVHPHRFRRTLATNLINRGMSVQEVAKILGHENINTTMTYIYVDKNNVKTSYRKYT